MNRKRNILFGVGINDADYVVKPLIDGRQVVCKFYRKWENMLSRCYSSNYHKNQPTYIGCSVCDEWLLFSNFKSWMEQQNWEGKELDKDLIVKGNKIYSPSTCVFIDKKVNSFLVENTTTRGEYPIGAYFSTREKRFKSQGKSIVTGKREGLGTYDTAEEAHIAWINFKLEQSKILAGMQEDNRVAEALIKRYTDYKQY